MCYGVGVIGDGEVEDEWLVPVFCWCLKRELLLVDFEFLAVDGVELELGGVLLETHDGVGLRRVLRFLHVTLMR